MIIKGLKYYFIFVIAFLIPFCICAQIGNPILNQTFGEGNPNPGPSLPIKNTSFNFTKDSCPAPGYYIITNNIAGCPAYVMGRSLDHTPPTSTLLGYMMIVNDTANSPHSRILYIDTIKKALCPGTSYEFSAWLLNINKPNFCATQNFKQPQFTFKVETPTGQLLQSSNTGPMPFDYNFSRTPKFHFYKVDFTLPNGVNDLVLKIMDDSSGYSPCGYAYALDDIQFAPIGPKAQMKFADDSLNNELVKAVCFQDNKTISFIGSMDAFYSNPTLQWQTSNDNGITWVDISGATSNLLSLTFSTPDTFLIHLTGSDASTITNPNCRVASNYVTVEVDGLPKNYIVKSNSPVCAGSNLQFNASGGASYLWWGPNGFSDNIAYPSIYNSSLKDSGNYYVEIFSYGGCHLVDSLQVKIIGTDVSVMPLDTSICLGNSIRLFASKGASYLWSPPNGLSNPKIINPIATPSSKITYTVKVTDNYGCSDTASTTINIINTVAVKANITATNYLCPILDSVYFVDNSLGNITNWYWNFGNGQTSILQNPPVQYYNVQANNYLVKLIVSDTTGCTDSATHILNAEDNCYIAVPNAFTPNGDGLNDYLYPLNAYKATNLVFRVFNRFGQLVFYSNNMNNKWDGKVGGLEQPVGAYVWMLEYNDEGGKKISLKGTTILIR